MTLQFTVSHAFRPNRATLLTGEMERQPPLAAVESPATNKNYLVDSNKRGEYPQVSSPIRSPHPRHQPAPSLPSSGSAFFGAAITSATPDTRTPLETKLFVPVLLRDHKNNKTRRHDHQLQQDSVNSYWSARRAKRLALEYDQLGRRKRTPKEAPNARAAMGTFIGTSIKEQRDFDAQIDFKLQGLKMALTEAVRFHHRLGSDKLAKVFHLDPTQVQCERGPKNELILPATKEKAARGVGPYIYTLPTGPHGTSDSRDAAGGAYGIPGYCYCVLMLDLEHLVHNYGLGAALESVGNLQLWRK